MDVHGAQSTRRELVPLPPVVALRADLVAGHLPTERTGAWLAFASACAFRLTVPPATSADDGRSSAFLSECAAILSLVIPPSVDGRLSGDGVSALARAVAEEAEEAGALNLAVAILESASRGEGVGTLEAGRLLAQHARVMHKAGLVEQAATLYDRVEAMGNESDLPELRVRAEIGRGVLARYRGNYPAVRAHFEEAVRLADASGVPALAALAHHGLMIAAVRAGAFEEALLHGWDAFHDVEGDAQREAEMLLNLGQLLVDVGRPRAGLSAFAAALRRGPAPRLTLHALGGVALAAAAVEDVSLVRLVRRSVTRVANGEGLAYPHASTLLDVAEAFMHLGASSESGSTLTDAMPLLAQYEFHELRHRAESVRVGLGDATRDRAVPVLGRAGERVVQGISELDDPTRLPTLVGRAGRRIATST